MLLQQKYCNIFIDRRVFYVYHEKKGITFEP